jgi:hypothetical protein
MDSTTLAKLIACPESELKKRELVYPRKLARGKMSLAKCRHEIACMQRIVEVLKGLESEHSRKLKLFA